MLTIKQISDLTLDEVKALDLKPYATNEGITKIATEIEAFAPGYAKFMLAEPPSPNDQWSAGNNTVAWFILALGSAMNPQAKTHYRAVLRKLAKQKIRLQ